MLAEFVNKIQQLTSQAEQARTFRPDCEPSHVYYLQHGQNVRKVEATQPLQHATLTSLKSFVQYAVDQTHDSIWVGDNKIVSLLDENGETGTFYLKQSPQMELLKRLESSITFYKQKDLIQLLRRYFPSVSANNIQPFRMVKFRSDQSGESTIDHGKASVGKSLKAELVGAVAIPEEIQVTLPVFAGGEPDSDNSVVLCVEIDLEKEQFAIYPTAGAMASLYEEELSIIEREIAKKLFEITGKTTLEIPIYRGSPK